MELFFIVFVVIMVGLNRQPERRTYIIDGDIKSVFEQTQSLISIWKNVRISDADRLKHYLQLHTRISIWSFGESIKIQFKQLEQTRVEIMISSTLNFGLDLSGMNLKNLNKFEEIMGLEPAIATYVAKSITH